MIKAMLPKKTKITIKNEWSKCAQNMGIIGKTQIINHSATNKTIMLISAMVKKIAMEMEDTNATNPSSVKSHYTIQKGTELKVIAGYKCNKVTMTDSANNKIVLWITKELPSYKNKNLPDIELEGFPMEYSMVQNDMRIRMTASKVSAKKIDLKEFEIPEGYEMKTQEEIGELMQGMDFGGK